MDASLPDERAEAHAPADIDVTSLERSKLILCTIFQFCAFFYEKGRFCLKCALLV
jgi:hypothetical protein